MEGGVTVQEQLERVGWGRFQLIALAAFVLFLVSDGMELVVTNIIWQDLPLEEWGVDRDEHGKRGELVSLAFIGFVLGAFCSALLGDNIGRRPLFFLHGAIFLPMSLLSACSQSLLQLGATRFFVGISMGLVLPCVNSMMTELAPIEFRAKAVISIPGVAYR
jgi:AAHS family benzoate transporter-like MFS transporter